MIIKKISDRNITKNFAQFFKTYNLIECKGIHSSLTASAYYKTIGYAGLLINQLNSTSSSQCSPLDLSITFLTFRYPRKLLTHLISDRKLTVEKICAGIYHISIETFDIQIIVTQQLPPEENLYLRCLTSDLKDTSLIHRLVDDYTKHQNEDIYIKYMNQLTTANIKTEGEFTMVCEGLFNLFGTSSAEIIAQAKQEARKESETQIRELSLSVEQLSSQIDHLKELLRKNNISFE